MKKKKSDIIRIKAIQNSEFQEALQKDKEKQAKIKKEIDEAKQKDLEEKRKKEEEEKKKIEEEKIKLELKEKMKAKKDLFLIEPEENENVSTIMFRLTSGKKMARRFHKTTKVRHLYDYVDTLDDPQIIEGNYQLMETMPKKALENLDSTLEESNLHPKSMLVVELKDL